MNISNVITAELLHDIGKLMPRGKVECIRDTVTIQRDYKSKLLPPEQFWCTLGAESSSSLGTESSSSLGTESSSSSNYWCNLREVDKYKRNRKAGAFRSQEEKIEKLELSAPRGAQMKSKGWYEGAHLPHYDDIEKVQAITFRLCDSLPQTKLAELQEELGYIEREKRELYKRKRIEDWIDAGYGCCALSKPEMAEVMEKALFHFDGDKYKLVCWCVMPNHVHVMIAEKSNLSKIVQSWKSYTGRWALANLPDEWLPVMKAEVSLEGKAPAPWERRAPAPWERRAPALRENNNRRNRKAGAFRSQGRFKGRRFWMPDFWDRYIRNGDHFRKVVEYIHNNPVKAGLCKKAEDWRWSSAWYQSN